MKTATSNFDEHLKMQAAHWLREYRLALTAARARILALEAENKALQKRLAFKVMRNDG